MPELNDSSNIVTTIASGDYIVVETAAGVVKRITRANLAALLSGGGSGATLLMHEDFATNGDLDGRAASPTPGTSNWSNAGGASGTLIGSGGVLQIAGSNAANYLINVGQRNVDVSVKLVVAGAHPLLRIAHDGSNNYVQIDLTQLDAYQIVSGSQTTLHAASTNSVNGDIVRVVLNGTTLTVYRNGTQVYQVTSVASSTGTRIGISYVIDSDSQLDDLYVYQAS